MTTAPSTRGTPASTLARSGTPGSRARHQQAPALDGAQVEELAEHRPQRASGHDDRALGAEGSTGADGDGAGLRRFLRWSEQLAASVGLTPMQHQLLLAVRGHDERRGPAVTDVAEHLLVRHNSAVELVDRAEATGLVERHAEADDARVVRLRLTPLGGERLEALAAATMEEVVRLAAGMELDLDRARPHFWMLLGEARSKCDHIRFVPLSAETADRLSLVYFAKGVNTTTVIEVNTLTQEQVEERMRGELELPTSKEYLGVEIDNMAAAYNDVVPPFALAIRSRSPSRHSVS